MVNQQFIELKSENSFKTSEAYGNYLRKNKPVLSLRKKQVEAENKDLKPYTNKDYYCETCLAKDGLCHPKTGYCFICNTDNWKLNRGVNI